MPYFNDPNLNKDDEENPNGQTISGASPSVNNSGNATNNSSTGAATSSNAQGGGAGSASTGSGSGFQDLDKYLQNNASSNLGQQLQSNVSGQIDSAKQGMSDASNQYTAQVNAGQANTPTQDQINSQINLANTNPSAVDPTAYQSWLNNTYTGPTSLAASGDTYSKYQSGINQAVSSADALNTEPGRFALLDQYYGNPAYNFGDKSLDNLLVQQGSTSNQINSLRNQAQGLNTAAVAQGTQFQNQAAQAEGNVASGVTNAKAALGLDANGQPITGGAAGEGALGTAYDAAQAGLTTTNANAMNAYNALYGAAGGGNGSADLQLTPEQQRALGLQDYTGSLYNVDLSNYINQNSPATLNQSMTPQQQAQIRALESLGGLSDTLASGSLSSYSPYTVDQGGLMSAIQNAQQQYQTGLTALQNQWNSIGGTAGNGQTAAEDYAYWSNPNNQYVSNASGAVKNWLNEYEALQKGFNVGDAGRTVSAIPQSAPLGVAQSGINPNANIAPIIGVPSAQSGPVGRGNIAPTPTSTAPQSAPIPGQGGPALDEVPFKIPRTVTVPGRNSVLRRRV